MQLEALLQENFPASQALHSNVPSEKVPFVQLVQFLEPSNANVPGWQALQALTSVAPEEVLNFPGGQLMQDVDEELADMELYFPGGHMRQRLFSAYEPRWHAVQGAPFCAVM